MTKYNNAEFSNLVNRIHTLLSALKGKEGFPIPEAKMQELKDVCDTMTYALSYSRTMPETVAVEEADKKLDKVIVYFHRAVRNECDSHNASKATVAQALYEKTRPFVGIQSLPLGQQVATTVSYLEMLKDEAASIEAVGLTSTIEEMTLALEMLKNALDTRTAAEANTVVSKAAENRPAYCSLVADVVALFYANALINPTDANKAQMKNLEQIITDQENAHRLRRSKAQSPDAPEDTPDTSPEDSAEDSTGSSSEGGTEGSTEGDAPKE